jgi:predicted peptidase
MTKLFAVTPDGLIFDLYRKLDSNLTSLQKDTIIRLVRTRFSDQYNIDEQEVCIVESDMMGIVITKHYPPTEG